ncbi:MAG: nucleotide exchange factor GrpE [Candidatus Kuenenbacteria bacterium]
MTKKTGKLDELEQQCAEYLAGWQRAQADYQNLEKEVEKNKKNIIKFANIGLLTEILLIYDNLKLAIKHIPENQRQIDWVIGIQHIKNQFHQCLERSGIEEIKTKEQEFNPEIHEAVEQESRIKNQESGKDKDIIKKEIKAGYKLNGKVLYPAKVIVE